MQNANQKAQISLRIRSICCWAGRFESYLVANSEDRFSRDDAQLYRSQISDRIYWRTSLFGSIILLREFGKFEEIGFGVITATVCVFWRTWQFSKLDKTIIG